MIGAHCHTEVATDAVRKPNLTEIDENTRGSMANQKAVRPLEVWLSTLFIADCFVCIMGGPVSRPSFGIRR